MLTEINHRLNPLLNRLMTGQSDISTSNKYIDALQKVLSKYLYLPNNLESNSWPFYNFLKIHLIIFNKTLLISIEVPLKANPFHLWLYQLHGVPRVNTILHNTIQIQHILDHYKWRAILCIPNKLWHNSMSQFWRTFLSPIRSPTYNKGKQWVCTCIIFWQWMDMKCIVQFQFTIFPEIP